MSIGVESIDNDHKRLLEIINRLYDAIDLNAAETVLEDTFESLESYVVEHFQREEALMQQYGYAQSDEHIKQHRAFAAKVPELKEQLLGAKNYLTAQEVTIYLTDWLVNHIISEDLKLVRLFEDAGIASSREMNRGLLNRVLNRVAKIFSFGRRISYVMTVPFIGMLILGGIILSQEWRQYQNMVHVSHVSHIVSDVNALIDAVQVERGLGTFVLTSDDEASRKELLKQYKKVDRALKAFFIELDTAHPRQLDAIASNIERLRQDQLQLQKIRKKILYRSVSNENLVTFYTQNVSNLLKIASAMVHFKVDRELSTAISAHSAMLYYKEMLGLQKVYGTLLIDSGGISDGDYKKFLEYTGAKKIYMRSFESVATHEQLMQKEQVLSVEQTERIAVYEEKISKKSLEGLSSKVWFDSMQTWIKQIRGVADELAKNVSRIVSERIDDSVTNLIVWSIFMAVIIIVAQLVAYLFKESSLRQIARLTEAMQGLAEGNRSLRLRFFTKDDEIGQMAQAYEVSRQNLLRGDIYAQLYLNQKDIELEDKQRENRKLEKMAFVDPLTGATNRRKYELIAALEYERSKRYGHPLTLMMLDIDHFKEVNDTYGHAAGDEVLKVLVKICHNSVRSLDTVARIGGEEFVVMLPETDLDAAYSLAQRIRQEIANTAVECDGTVIQFTVSIGVTTLKLGADKVIEDTLERADKALYRAKNEGRNRTVSL